MNPDLQRLIDLQRLESAAEAARRQIAEEPARLKNLEDRLETARAGVARAKEQLAEAQNIRRVVERDFAAVQSRLTKYKDQLMEVKTNREYQAMQHEIAVAQTEAGGMEERILELMLQMDELTAAVKEAEAALAQEQALVNTDTRGLAEEITTLKATLERALADRQVLVAAIDKHALATFELVARQRKGVAVAEARDGICTICHVRLRPQVFNNIRGNAGIIQCDSCHRILYFVPSATAQPDSSPSQPQQ